jgi:RNA polymerase sigma-70 factor (ECF subfamily)
LPTGLFSTEPELAGRLAQGDPAAWKELCETYGRPLYLYAYHRTGDASAAEDVRQETLLAAVESIAGYRGEAPLFAWLCGIARRKAADELGHRGRQDLPLETADQETWQQLERQPLPDELVERAETRAAVVEALWSLPEDYREALLARYVRGESVTEIAARLGRSYKAAESVLSRAREALLRNLKKEGSCREHSSG